MRFKEISRYFYISLFDMDITGNKWHCKVSPLSNWLQWAFAKYVQLPQNIAIDEQIVRQTGNSSDTVIIKSKPILESYKIWALAFLGFTWNWMFYSHTKDILQYYSRTKGVLQYYLFNFN